MKKFIKKHYKGLLVTFVLLIVVGDFAVKKNREEAERKEAIRVEHVKKVEYKIAKDFADHYAGVKKIKFDHYFALPMGHVVFPMIINDLDDEKHTLSYTIDNWKPALEDYDVIPVKKGKTNIKDVEIVYNTKELR